jgi:hypothetical protein
MSKDERIILMLALIALVALVIGKWKASHAPAGYTPSEGLTNLNYNQPRWAFAPPVANILPQSAASMLGVPLPDGAKWSTSDCGCY